MAEEKKSHPVIRLLALLKLDKNDISALYFYSILAGIIQLSVPLGVQAIINFVTFNALSTSLVVLIALVITGTLLGGLLQINQMRLTEKIQQKIFTRYSFGFAQTLPKIDLRSIDEYYLPELTNRFFDTLNLQKGISKLLLDVPAAIIQIIFGVLLLSFYHPLFIAFGALLLLLVVLILRLTSERGLETSLQESDYKYKVAAWLQDISTNLNTFKNYNSSELNLNRTDFYVRGYLRSRTKHFRVLLTQYSTLVVFKVLLTAAILIIGCWLLLNQLINIGQFIASEIVILTITASVEKLIISIDQIYDVLTADEKLNKVLLKPIEKDKSFLSKHSSPIKIQFENVTFAYTFGGNVLNDISFEIKPGEKVLLSRAKSGFGGSTILKILDGQYKPNKGYVFIDDVPQDNYQLEDYRNGISYMSDLNEIFNSTLWENITLGRSTIGIDEVSQLINDLGFVSFLESFDKGYDTVLYTGGFRLPSHLIQKILILRALIEPRRLILLDEPFRNLNDERIKAVGEYIQKINATVVAVSPKDNVKKYFDRVIEL